jgi:hypothetical protein
MSEEVNILCMKWGTKYGPEYVNFLRASVRRHLPRPHRFICFTDDASGLAPDIEVLPLPPVDLPSGSKERGWNKLGVFRNPLGDLTGTALFLDLDLVILDDLSPFFEFPGEFCIIRDWVTFKKERGNSSVFRFELGRYPHLVEKFGPERTRIQEAYRNEQEYVTAEVGAPVTFWPSEWCASFKRHAIPRGLAKLWKAPAKPAGARVLVFHGQPNPPEAIKGESGKWFRPIKPSPWIADFWHDR